jgi:hypothetical protein
MNVTKLIAAAMMVCGLSAFAQEGAPAAGGAPSGEQAAPAEAPKPAADKKTTAHKHHAHKKAAKTTDDSGKGSM